MPQRQEHERLKVAIIGGGPAGLGAAIELSRLPFVDWQLYEKRSKLTEIGGGFTLQPQTWRLLEHNGVAKNISTEDYFRAPDGQIEQRRNGRTGELLLQKHNTADVPPTRQSCRLTRAKLQAALLKNTDTTRVHLSKKLVDVSVLPNHRVQIHFADNSQDQVDLLIAADGIRSSIRKFAFPHHTLQYNGQSVYRTIVSKTEASQIEGIPWAPTFWKHKSGLYVFTCPLGDDDFEVTARIRRSGTTSRDPVSWGRPFHLQELLHAYDDFCEPVRRVLHLAANGNTQEFALFAGPRLERIVFNDNIALIGDASHALLGNFGSGAGFALEDVYVLTKVLEFCWTNGGMLADALALFDSIRSPYYARLHRLIDEFAAIKATIRTKNLSINREIAERVRRISLASESWMYRYDVEVVVTRALTEHLAENQRTSTIDSTKSGPARSKG